MSDNLQEKTFSGMVWGFAGSFSVQIIYFVQSIILARLLTPSEFGLVGMIGIFLGISRVMISCGFSAALVRKNDRTEIDYSTVYVTNFVLSFIFCGLLCLAAPLIARFYNEPQLKNLVFANALIIFLGAFIAVQGTRMSINLEFRKQNIIGIISSIVVAISSVAMAYMGYGVWALVWPSLFSMIATGIMYWYYQHWFPGLGFSWKSFREFFSYGSKIMLAGIIDITYSNIAILFIGKKYTAADTGYYTRAYGYACLPSFTIDGVIKGVTFPVLSKVMDDKERLEHVYRRLIRMAAYMTFPIMFGMAVLARPLVVVLITEKWLPCVVLLQILCFYTMWVPIHSLNMNLLKLSGRTDLFLRIEIIKKIVGVVVLLITLPFGVKWMCIGYVFTAFVFLFINTYYTGKMINVGFIRQMLDMMPTLLYCIGMSAVVMLVSHFMPNDWSKLIVGVVVGALFYYGISVATKSRDLAYAKLLLRENVFSKFKKR